jgi:serine/threonine-protein kinase
MPTFRTRPRPSAEQGQGRAVPTFLWDAGINYDACGAWPGGEDYLLCTSRHRCDDPPTFSQHDRFPEYPDRKRVTAAYEPMTKSRDFLGPYRLARLIRQGSTCDVWEAVDEQTQDRYALKVLNNRFREDKVEIASLKFEYTVAKDLVSPRIIRVVSYRVEGGTPFLVMELFSELNMKQALRRGPESLAFMLDKIVEQAAEGLYYMHTKGWIHRDIKPDNFLVSREGETKLIDFTIAEKKKTGLGKLFHRSGSTVQGTRSYMAPEQIQGGLCDERTDVYSFGCVLFEAVTGKPPYTGQTPNDLLSKHLTASIPSPVVYNDNVTPEFASLIRRMMAKKPAQRPDSMWEFLKEYRTTQVFKKRPKPPEVSVFDNMPGIKSAEDMFKKPASEKESKADESEKPAKSDKDGGAGDGKKSEPKK